MKKKRSKPAQMKMRGLQATQARLNLNGNAVQFKGCYARFSSDCHLNPRCIHDRKKTRSIEAAPGVCTSLRNAQSYLRNFEAGQSCESGKLEERLDEDGHESGYLQFLRRGRGKRSKWMVLRY